MCRSLYSMRSEQECIGLTVSHKALKYCSVVFHVSYTLSAIHEQKDSGMWICSMFNQIFDSMLSVPLGMEKNIKK